MARRTREGVTWWPRHRRDWRRWWRYCRCGLRWRCPDLVGTTPMPFPPTVAEQPAIGRVKMPNALRAFPTPWPRNERPWWNSPSGIHQIGRAGRLTPAQAHRARGTG